MNAGTIAACVMAAIALAGYLNERRKTRRGEKREDRADEQDLGDVINRRVELLLLNLSTERDRLSKKVDQLEGIVDSLREEVVNLREALRVATRGQ